MAALLSSLERDYPRTHESGPFARAATGLAYLPAAVVISKTRYSGFAEPHLLAHLQQREADGLIITGSETDVCVLATVLDAVDLGYRVIVVTYAQRQLLRRGARRAAPSLSSQIHRADRDCKSRDGVGPVELRGGAPEQA